MLLALGLAGDAAGGLAQLGELRALLLGGLRGPWSAWTWRVDGRGRGARLAPGVGATVPRRGSGRANLCQSREKGRWCAAPRSSSTSVRIATVRSGSRTSICGGGGGCGAGVGGDGIGGRRRDRARGPASAWAAPGRVSARGGAGIGLAGRWRGGRADARRRRRRACGQQAREEAPLGGSGAGVPARLARAAAELAAAPAGSATSATAARLGLRLRAPPPRARPAGACRRRREHDLRAPPGRRELHRAACAIALPGDGGLGLDAGDADLAELREMAAERVLAR